MKVNPIMTAGVTGAIAGGGTFIAKTLWSHNDIKSSIKNGCVVLPTVNGITPKPVPVKEFKAMLAKFNLKSAGIVAAVAAGVGLIGAFIFNKIQQNKETKEV